MENNKANEFNEFYANLGDTVIVCGQAFVIDCVMLELNKPATLITKQPIEYLEV